jgi:ABC-2 type transport system ATP-binding protein
MNSVISLIDVKKNYPGFSLDIPRLDIREGYITGFIGENGAGKTTTLRIIMDMLRPDSGSIRVLGGNLGKDADIKQDIGYVDSLAYFSPQFLVGRAKSIVAPFFRNWDEDLYQSYRKRFNIQENKKLKDLSSGQNKLFSLVMALCRHPKLLILDEPTSALDPIVRAEILDILAEQLQDASVSILYSTHITSDLDKTADYIVYLHQGKIILDEEKDRMLDEFRLVKGESKLTGEAGSLLLGVRDSSVGFTALTRRGDELTKRFGERIVLEKPNLEDIMIHLAKEDARHA